MYVQVPDDLGQEIALADWSSAPRGSELGQSSAPASRSSRRVKRFVCREADRAAIERLIGKSVSIDALQASIAAAAEKASSLASKAAGELRRSRRSPKTIQLFRESFGTAPSFVPSWRPAGATWDRGGIVRTRLRRAVKILNDGHIKYHCWGPGALPSLSWKSTSAAFSAPGKYALYFGEAFWRARLEGAEIKMAAVLLRKALFIYYGPQLKNVKGRKGFGNIYCYARFVLRTNDFPVPPTTERGCQQTVTPPRGPVPPPKTSTTPQPRPPNLRDLPETFKKRFQEQLDREAEQNRLTNPTESTQSPGKSLQKSVEAKIERFLKIRGVPRLIRKGIQKAARSGSESLLKKSLEQAGFSNEEVEAVVSITRGAVKTPIR